MHRCLRLGFASAALLLPAFLPSLAAAAPDCPDGSRGQSFDGLQLCVPAGNERYRFTKDGIDWMAWSGDAPVTAQEMAATPDLPDQTRARAWIGESVVGKSDLAAGKKGFDQFMALMATAILKAGNQAQTGADFEAAVPVDESGQTLSYRFRAAEPDLLIGERVQPTAPGPAAILFRPSSGNENPHLALCKDHAGDSGPLHVCMSMFVLDRHRAGIVTMGRDLPRNFRIFEAVAKDLESFAVRATP